MANVPVIIYLLPLPSVVIDVLRHVRTSMVSGQG